MKSALIFSILFHFIYKDGKHDLICKAERNRDTDVENKYMDTKWEGGGWEELGDWN